MKKILHIAKVTSISGAENHLLTLLPNLNKSKYDVSFLILTEADKPVNEYFDMFKERGVKTERITISKWDFDPICFWKVYNFIRRGNFDIVHTHLIHADLYGALAAKLAGIKYVISTKHGYHTSRIFCFLNKIVSSFIDKTITISDALRNHFYDVERIGKGKMITIYYALDDNYRSKANLKKYIRNQLGIRNDIFLIAIVGRLIEVKGHKYLFEALYKIKNRYSNFRLLVIGDGVLKDDLQILRSKLNLIEEIVFLGYRNDVSNILSEIDLVVLPSLGEGFGLVLLEAMAYEKPVIATGVMSIPEIVIDGETGLLVPPRDSDALADAIIRLMENKEWAREMGLAGRKRLEESFTIEKMVKRTEELYDSLLSL